MLAHRSSTVTAIAEALSLEVSDISRCLSKLDEMGLVECRQIKKYRMYTLATSAAFDRNCELATLTIRPIGCMRVAIDVPLR
ncbi:MAG: helix-turn-helix transcriptional regulator [Candidatus Competibacteraceae bacterium]|nr:helix-turn-helix transcriptional regulator [Candidatus Competibacteraceae bacterium]